MCSFSFSSLWRTVPSITVSPIVATSPPITDGSTTTLTSTCFPVARDSASARRRICSSSSGTADRTSACSCLRSNAASSRNRSMIEGRSCPRPAPTMNDAIARVTARVRPSRSSSTIAARRSAGSPGLASAMRSSSLPSTTRAKRNSSSSTSRNRSSACAIVSNPRAYASIRSGIVIRSWPCGPGRSGPARCYAGYPLRDARSRLTPHGLIEEALDELAVGVVVEVAFDDLAREVDRETAHVLAQLDERLHSLVVDVRLGTLPDLARLLLCTRDQLAAHLFGRLPGFFDDPAGLVAGLADLPFVLRLLRVGFGV